MLTRLASRALFVAFVALLSLTAALAQQPLTVIAPNGGERYEMTDPIVVEWSAPTSRAVRVEYSPNGGRVWIPINEVDAALGTLTFTPGYPTPFGRIRVTDVDRPEIFDLSDGTFEILEAPSIAIFTPSHGDELIRGETYVISWIAGRVRRVNIEYSPTAGADGSWQRIASNIDATYGYHVWTVPASLTSLGKIRILDAEGPTVGETGIFAIVNPPSPVASIRVLRPNGGEVYTVGDAITVSWAASNIGPTVVIDLSSDGGATWINVIGSAPSAAGTATFVATRALVPVPGSNFRVRVVALGGPSDASDASFEIRRLVEPRITITYPNGGQVFATDSTIDVTWTAVDITGTLDVEYSLDSGATWSPIGSADAAAGTIEWEIPDELTTLGLVRVAGGPIADTSDAVFSIIEPESDLFIEVLSPNERSIEWAEASMATITWRSAGVARVDITLSTDGGASWGTTIAQNVAAVPGSFEWRVPHLADTNLASLLVRVASTAGGAPFDYSDAPFHFRPTFASIDVDRAEGVVRVAPNPASSMVRIAFDEPMTSLRLYDPTGSLVAMHELASSSRAMTLDVESLAHGVYICELRGVRATRRVRLVVR